MAKYKLGEEERKEKRKNRMVAKKVFSKYFSSLNENLFSRIKFYFVLVILATREYDQS